MFQTKGISIIYRNYSLYSGLLEEDLAEIPRLNYNHSQGLGVRT
jgi:hypothetical protein